MRKRAEHHPLRVHEVVNRRPSCARLPWECRTPGPRRLRTIVYEWYLRGPDGFYIMPHNFASEVAHTTCWDKCVTGNAKPGAYRRSYYVEGHAKPIRKRVVKRYK